MADVFIVQWWSGGEDRSTVAVADTYDLAQWLVTRRIARMRLPRNRFTDWPSSWPEGATEVVIVYTGKRRSMTVTILKRRLLTETDIDVAGGPP